MNGYRIAYSLMNAIGFALKALMVLIGIAIAALVAYTVWVAGVLVWFLAGLGAAALSAFVMFWIFTLHDWLERKART